MYSLRYIIDFKSYILILYLIHSSLHSLFYTTFCRIYQCQEAKLEEQFTRNWDRSEANESREPNKMTKIKHILRINITFPEIIIKRRSS